jgi:hypothetical protein
VTTNENMPPFLVLLAIPVLCLASLAQTGKVEPLGAMTAAVVSAPVTQVLDSQGQRLTLPDDTALCDIWMRKNVPARTAKDSGGVLYPELVESVLVGVISFPQAAADFRGQPIAPGTYTMRYALMPDDGNHLGVAPDRDFLLLVRAADDPDPAAVFKFADLVGLSRKAMGSNHPGVFSLTESKAGSALTLVKNAEDHWIFSGAVMKLDSGKDLPLSLIVKGTAPQ